MGLNLKKDLFWVLTGLLIAALSIPIFMGLCVLRMAILILFLFPAIPDSAELVISLLLIVLSLWASYRILWHPAVRTYKKIFA